MINPDLGYSDETEALIQRMCRYVERPSFRLNRDKAAELLMQTYDLFNLPRPKKVVWCVDPFTDEFQKSAGSAWSARSAGPARSAWSAESAGSAGSAGPAGSAWSAGSARSAGSAWSARSAGSAGSAWSARSAGSAGSAWSARSAGSAGSAWSARSAAEWSALDYDFWYYVFSYEYVRNPNAEWAPNENDRNYIAYCDLLLQALEAGAGYRVEWEDTLYIVPTPLVKIDGQNRFHSEDGPAIRWKQGREFHYLYGESFDKKLWDRVTSGNLTAPEMMAIEDADQRSIAMTYLTPADMIQQMNMKLLHTGIKGNKLYECKDYLGSGETEYALWMKDASTPREFIHFVPKDFDFHDNADEATAGMFRNGAGDRMPVEDYLLIEQEG